jgi:hypothetical protein
MKIHTFSPSDDGVGVCVRDRRGDLENERCCCCYCGSTFVSRIKGKEEAASRGEKSVCVPEIKPPEKGKFLPNGNSF